MSQHSCIGYQGTSHESATSHFVGGTGTTYVTPQVFDPMSTHTYPPQDPDYQQFAHSSTYPPPCYHCSPYFPPYYPPHPHRNCFTQTLYPHSTPPTYCYEHQTPIQSSCEQGGSTNLSEQHLDGMPQPYGLHNLNRQSLFLADGTQRSYYALPENYSLEPATSSSPAMPTAEVSNSCQSFTPPRNDQISEKETHPGTETQSIRDMLAQIQSKLQTMSENLREDLKHMKRPETKQPAASQPNPSTQEAINISDEMPLYEVYAEEDNSCSIGVCSVLDTSLVNPQDGDGEPDTWPLGRATPEPVLDVYDDETDGCSSEFVDVFASTHEQQIYEQKQQEKCFSKPICSPERPPVDVFSLSNEKKPDKLDCAFELQQQDDESECNFSVLKASNSIVTRSNHFRMEQSMKELRLQWDPGIAISSYSTPNASPQVHYCAQEEKNAAAVYHVLLIQLPMTKTCQIWDPGIESLFSSCKRLNITELIQIQGWTSMTMRHLLSVKFFIETATIMCCSLPKLIQQRRNVAAVLYSWRSIFPDMHYRQIFLKCKAMSSQLYWHEDIKFIGIPLWLINFQVP